MTSITKPDTFVALPDRTLIRSGGRSVRHILARVCAPVAPPRTDRLPVNVAFVLDRSGSMHGEKLHLARQAVLTALRSLQPQDRFSVVVYDNVVDVVMPSTSAGAEARIQAERLLRQVHPRGSTNLFGGWLTGCEQVAAYLSEEAVGRCLLMTDGLANVGITDREQLILHAAELQARGISTSTFGVGADFDEVLLEQMATRGGGHFYYVQAAAQIPDYIAGEVGEALEVVARDVTLQVDVPAGASLTSVSDLPTVTRGDHVSLSLGSLVSEQLFDAVLAIRFAKGTDGDRQGVTLRLVDRDETLHAAEQALSFTYGPHRENDGQARDRVVDLEVARAYAARAQMQALEHNRRGDYHAAQHVLQATAARIPSYAFGDPEFLAIADELDVRLPLYSMAMSVAKIKEEHSIAYQVWHSRDAKGHARKPQK